MNLMGRKSFVNVVHADTVHKCVVFDPFLQAGGAIVTILPEISTFLLSLI